MNFEQLAKSIQWINGLLENREQPKYLLDPLTSIVKLAMLQYKCLHTKIRIYNNKISYSDPTFFQPLNRWMMGDSRANIHYLYLPILYFCYLKYDCLKNNDNPMSPSLIKVTEIFNEAAVKGLQALKVTYQHSKNDLVINCLDLYLLMLGSEDEPSIRKRYETANITTKKTYEEFLKCWTPNNVEVLLRLFEELRDRSDNREYVEKNLKVVDDYLEAINHSINGLRDP